MADFGCEGFLYHLVHEWAVEAGAVSNVIVPAHIFAVVSDFDICRARIISGGEWNI